MIFILGSPHMPAGERESLEQHHEGACGFSVRSICSSMDKGRPPV